MSWLSDWLHSIFAETKGMPLVYVDPSAPSGGNGSLSSPFNSWASVTFIAGGSYRQKAGTTYSGAVYIGTSGTAAANIVIGAYGAGVAPAINGTITLDRASYVHITGLAISGASAAAIVIQNASNNLTISGNTIHDSQIGIWLGSGSGADSLIQANAVSRSSAYGIALHGGGASSGHETRISGNTVSDCGSHGIEIQSNYVIVDSNTVTNCGSLVPGSSGIHTFATGSDGMGSHNTITNNVTVSNRDPVAQDGNGIELDQWTHDNTVRGNFAYANDGAGIVMYDASSNVVSQNFLAANAADSGHTHSARGEMVLNQTLGLTRSNALSGNTFLSAYANVPAVFADSVSAGGGNTSSGDLLQNMTGGVLFSWGGQTGATQADLNKIDSADKTMGVVTFPASSYTGSYNYTFAPSTMANIDGKVIQAVGWVAGGKGLGVN